MNLSKKSIVTIALILILSFWPIIIAAIPPHSFAYDVRKFRSQFFLIFGISFAVLIITYGIQYLSVKGKSKFDIKELLGITITPLGQALLSAFLSWSIVSQFGADVVEFNLWLFILSIVLLVLVIGLTFLLDKMILHLEANNKTKGAINLLIKDKLYFQAIANRISIFSNFFTKNENFLENIIITKKNIFVIQVVDCEDNSHFVATKDEKGNFKNKKLNLPELNTRIRMFLQDLNKFNEIKVKENEIIKIIVDINKLNNHTISGTNAYVSTIDEFFLLIKQLDQNLEGISNSLTLPNFKKDFSKFVKNIKYK